MREDVEFFDSGTEFALPVVSNRLKTVGLSPSLCSRTGTVKGLVG